LLNTFKEHHEIKGFYISDLLSWGPYGSNGFIARVNIDVFLKIIEKNNVPIISAKEYNSIYYNDSIKIDEYNKTKGVIVINESYGGKILLINLKYLEENYPDIYNKLEDLNNYIVLDDEEYYRREYEKLKEDWEEYGSNDVFTAMGIDNDDENIFELKNKAFDWLNEEGCAIIESDGENSYFGNWDTNIMNKLKEYLLKD
jgi:hypothetical protein